MHPPLLLAYAAAYVRSRGHRVEFIDAEVDAISVEDFVSEVEHNLYDYIIFETSTASFKNDVEVARKIKERVSCKIVLVGPHVSALPEESLEGNSCDAVITGEYEISLGEYIEKGPDGTKGVCYRRQDGKVILNPPRDYILDLDSLPLPARDLLPNYKYFDPILKNPFTFVLSGRGCPYKCTFCNWPQVLTGRQYRLRSPANVVNELEILNHEYKFESILFNDDTFTVNKKHAMEICDEIIRRGLKISWGCYARADNDDTELLKKLKEAGCYLLKVGIESGDQTILDNIHKNYKIENVINGVRLIKKLGFNVHGTFVFGLPGETADTINRTIDFARRLGPTSVQFSTAVCYPGTEFYSYCTEHGYLLSEDWDDYMPMYPIFEYPDLSWEDMRDAVRKAYRKYYFRLGYMPNGFKRLVSEPKTTFSNFKKLVRLAF